MVDSKIDRCRRVVNFLLNNVFENERKVAT